MFSWTHFGVKVIAIINCYSKREGVAQGSCRPLLPQTNTLFLVNQKLLPLQDCSLELTIFLLHFQAQSNGEIA